MEPVYNSFYPKNSLRFWKAYFIQMRPYLLFISGIAGAAGIAMARQPETPAWKTGLSFILFFFAYGFGQALTDCFQTDTDKLSAPYRPLSKEIISIRSVLMVSITGLSASAVLLYLLHPISFLLSIPAVFGLATYSYVKKHFWFAGPFYNAAIVALLPAMGYFAASEHAVSTLPLHSYSFILVSFFSYAAFVLIGYLKDVEADRATGYKTFPVVFGWGKTILTGDFFVGAAIFLFWWHNNKNTQEIIFGFAGSLVLAAGQLHGHMDKIKNEKAALIPILSTVKGFVLLHIAIILHFQPYCGLYAVIYYLLFEITLYLRPSRYQV